MIIPTISLHPGSSTRKKRISVLSWEVHRLLLRQRPSSWIILGQEPVAAPAQGQGVEEAGMEEVARGEY